MKNPQVIPEQPILIGIADRQVAERQVDAELVMRTVQRGIQGARDGGRAEKVVLTVEQRQRLAIIPEPALRVRRAYLNMQPVRPFDLERPRPGKLELLA